MTPAQKLAASKPWRGRAQTKPNGKPHVRKRVWQCGLRAIREAHRLSLADVATAVGMTVSGLHEIELGANPRLDTVAKLTTFFGVDVWSIWKPV